MQQSLPLLPRPMEQRPNLLLQVSNKLDLFCISHSHSHHYLSGTKVSEQGRDNAFYELLYEGNKDLLH